jgi:hypothetical protein
MKAAAIIVLLALSFGGIRHARLKELLQKVVLAEQSASPKPGAESAKATGRPSDEIHPGSQVASSTFSPDLVDRLRVEFAIRNRLQPRAPGSNSLVIERALIRELSMLDQRGARKLIDELQSGADPAETDGVRD